MKLNLPNKLTLLRVCLIPFFVIALLFNGGNTTFARMLSLFIFLVASITDFFDGYIARRYNLITNFGKFMDPLADKLLVCSAFVCFTAIGQLNAYVVLIVLAREFIISGFRLVASDAGIVIAASKLGKAKTVVQMITVILLILDISELYIINNVFVMLTVVLTLASLIEYIYMNRSVILDNEF